MPHLPLRHHRAARGHRPGLRRLARASSERPARRAGRRLVPHLTRDVLYELYYPGLGDYDERLADPATPPAARVALLSLDPRNITLEPEYYADVDQERFARVKPLLWLWYSFDRSPLGGQNVHLGVRFRRMLARASLRPLRPQLQVLPVHRILLRLQPRGGRRRAWCTATCCSTTGAASRWATG